MPKLALAIAAALSATAASAAVDFYTPFGLTGAQEVPSFSTPGAGRGFIDIDGSTMTISVTWRDMLAPVTVSHIHCCAAFGANSGVAVDFGSALTGFTAGTRTLTFDLDAASTYTAGFITGSGGTVALARTRLLDAFENETAYFNLHSSASPAGEIRGQIAAVPEPGTWAMLITGFGLVGAAVRRRLPAHA
jgi:hypothetical protein